MSGLQPTCLLCFSICDNEGCLTSCDHYVCSRCASRLPDPATGAPCPLCRKPFRLVRLSHAGVQQLLADPLPGIQGGLKALQHQLSHHRQAAVRLKEALRLVHNRYTTSEQRVAELQQSNEQLRDENARLRQKLSEQAAALAARDEQARRGPHTALSLDPRSGSRVPSRVASNSPARPLQWSAMPPSPSPSRVVLHNTPPRTHAAPNVSHHQPAPLGWSVTSAAGAKRPRDDLPLPPARISAGGAWEPSRVLEASAAASDTASGVRSSRDGLFVKDQGASRQAAPPRHDHRPPRPPSPVFEPAMDFRMSTPLAQTLQRQHVHVPDSAIVPPTPRLFEADTRRDAARRPTASLQSAPKPLQGLLEACFRTPR